MAKIWIVQGTMQRGAPVAERTWPECQEKLELDEHSGTEERPKFGDKDTWPFETDVVVSVSGDEASEFGLGSERYFHSPLAPDEARVRLGLDDDAL